MIREEHLWVFCESVFLELIRLGRLGLVNGIIHWWIQSSKFGWGSDRSGEGGVIGGRIMRSMSLEHVSWPWFLSVSRLSWCELHLLRGFFWNKLSDTSASRMQVSPLDHRLQSQVIFIFSFYSLKPQWGVGKREVLQKQTWLSEVSDCFRYFSRSFLSGSWWSPVWQTGSISSALSKSLLKGEKKNQQIII